MTTQIMTLLFVQIYGNRLKLLQKRFKRILRRWIMMEVFCLRLLFWLWSRRCLMKSPIVQRLGFLVQR